MVQPWLHRRIDMTEFAVFAAFSIACVCLLVAYAINKVVAPSYP
jgi:hypothetical protein